MSKEVFHVVPQGEGWAVKREGNDRAVANKDTQKEAIDSAREAAKEGDEIVIHRADGTIRDRTTYSSSGGGNGHNNLDDSERRGTTVVRPSDVRSVGTRVSWGAVLAGAVVALAVYVTLFVLAGAIGVTTLEHLRTTTLAWAIPIVLAIALLAALFLGGYVASRTTAGEDKTEAAIYGVLVWGATFAMLFLAGNSVSAGLFSVLQPTAQTASNNNGGGAGDQAQPGANGEQQAKAQAAMDKARSLPAELSPTGMAWWTFASLVLSLLAAVGGSLVGAGPEPMFFFRRRGTSVRMEDRGEVRETVGVRT